MSILQDAWGKKKEKRVLQRQKWSSMNSLPERKRGTRRLIKTGDAGCFNAYVEQNAVKRTTNQPMAGRALLSVVGFQEIKWFSQGYILIEETEICVRLQIVYSPFHYYLYFTQLFLPPTHPTHLIIPLFPLLLPFHPTFPPHPSLIFNVKWNYNLQTKSLWFAYI